MSKLKTLSNPELLSLLRIRDQRAFTEIYNRYWQKLYAIAYNRLKDSQEAEDVVHDVLSSLWHNSDKSEIINLEAYLATAAKFRVLAIIRKESSKHTYEQFSSNSEISESYDLSEALHYKRVLQALNEEIENLPEKCRLVFKYSRHENMPVKEIASQLDLSTSTVENHLNKALKRLHMVMKKFSTYFWTF